MGTTTAAPADEPRDDGELRHLRAADMKLDGRYQSSERFSETHARRIAADFDWRTFNPVKVCQYHGDQSYWVVDGQHRRWAALERFGADVVIPAYFVGVMTPQEAAAIFARQAFGIRRVEANTAFYAHLFEGEETAVALQKVLDATGWRIARAKPLLKETGGTGRAQAQPGEIVAAAKLRGLFKQKGGPERVEMVLTLITAAWGDNPEGCTRQILGGLNAVLRDYDCKNGLDTDHLIDRLREYEPRDVSARLTNSMALEMGISRSDGGSDAAATAAIVKLYNRGLNRSAQLRKKGS